MFDIDKLSTAAKVEAMRYGHSAVVNNEELLAFIQSTTPYLMEGEHFAITPLGSLAESIFMYSVRVAPKLKIKVKNA